MAHIFISYSKEDIDFVRYLKTLLEQQGFAVWVDEARLAPSVRWWKSIENNIDSCSAFIVVMSPNAEESDWVEREILRAEDQKRPIFPVLLAGSPWSRLANIQYEDMRRGLHAQLSPHFIQSLNHKIPQHESRGITFTIEHGNIVEFPADVVVLKYAQAFYGADKIVAKILRDFGIREDLQPNPGEYRYVETGSALQSYHSLFVGTTRAKAFNYASVRSLAAQALNILAEIAPDTRHIAMTIHGVGFGLDEGEVLRAQFTGYWDALAAGQFPAALERITMVEFDERRFERLQKTLERHLVDVDYATPITSGWGYSLAIPTNETVKTVEKELPTKPHVFVAMHDETDEDIFYYGIQAPVHAQGLLCERFEQTEQTELTEDILNQIKQRIETASAIIADLTGQNPFVYLQIGYAWGKDRPTILFTDNAQDTQLAGETCLIYEKIRDLEDKIAQELDELKANGLL